MYKELSQLQPQKDKHFLQILFTNSKKTNNSIKMGEIYE